LKQWKQLCEIQILLNKIRRDSVSALLLLSGLASGHHDLLQSQGLRQVAADLDLAGHESRGGSDLT